MADNTIESLLEKYREYSDTIKNKFLLKDNSYRHPCLDAVRTFEFQEHQFENVPPPPIKPLTETPFYCISESEDLGKLIKVLEGVNEFALEPIINIQDESLEVLALSTKSADFLLDAHNLKDDIWRLGPVFCNPNIVKILSNGTSVLQKLQNIFSFYAVNIFDVNKAVFFLHKTKVNCAYTVLELIYSTDIRPILEQLKTVRPFTPAFLAQSRNRSHYLFQSYYWYKHQFLQCGHYFYVKFLEECRDACEYVYSEDFEESLLIEELKVQQGAELTLLRELHAWRSKTAETTTKPVTDVLTNSELLKISGNLPFDLNFLNAVTDSPVAYEEAYQILKMSTITQKQFNLRTGKLQLEQFGEETEESCLYVNFPVISSLRNKDKKFTGANEVCEHDFNEFQTKKNFHVEHTSKELAKEDEEKSYVPKESFFSCNRLEQEPTAECIVDAKAVNQESISTETASGQTKTKKKRSWACKRRKKRKDMEMMTLLQNELLTNDQLSDMLTEEERCSILELNLDGASSFSTLSKFKTNNKPKMRFFVSKYLSDPSKKELIIKAFKKNHGEKVDFKKLTNRLIARYEKTRVRLNLRDKIRREKRCAKRMKNVPNALLDEHQSCNVDLLTGDEFKRHGRTDLDCKPLDADRSNVICEKSLTSLDHSIEKESVIAVMDSHLSKDDDVKLILDQRLTSDNFDKKELLIEPKNCENNSEAILLSDKPRCNILEDRSLLKDTPDKTPSFWQNDIVSVVTNNERKFINKRKLEE